MALAENEKSNVVVLTGIALLAVLGAAWGIFVGVGQPVDGEALLAERFACAELPMDLTVARAHRLGNGDRMVELVPEEGGEASPLDRVVVHVYNKGKDLAMAFPDQPASLNLMQQAEWSKKPKGFFRGELQRGRVEFDTWDVMYIRERIFRSEAPPEAEGEDGDEGAPEPRILWADNLRVNLSNDTFPCVLYAYFPDGVDGDPAVLTDLLDGLDLR